MKKKILALILATSLLISAIPALAVEPADQTTGDQSTTADISETPAGVKLDKTLTYNEETGDYTIQLESFTTGTVTPTETTVPTDIILVLDQSGSMADNFKGESSNYQKSRQKALVDACNKFITNVVTSSYGKDGAVGGGDDIDHKIAVVEFTTKLKDPYDTILKTTEYKDVTKENQLSALNKAIKDLPEEPEGGTSTDDGMEEALNLLDANVKANGTGRNQVVVLFTDGTPGISDFEIGRADAAIKAAKGMKDLNATIYTVGIFKGANGDAGNIGKINNNIDNWSDEKQGNRFMQLTSSNSLEADDYGYNKDKNDNYLIDSNFDWSNQGFYLSASDSGNLNNIFDTISGAITTPSYEMGESSTVIDTVSPYFKVPEGFSQANVSAKIVPCIGYDKASGEYSWETDPKKIITVTEGIVANEKSKTVSVKGFDYDKNFVSQTARTSGTNENFYGSKLVISFNVTPIDGFIGGNGVPSNTSNSGIYDGNGNIIGAFPQPSDDLPIHLDINAHDQTIYLGNHMDYKDLLQIDGNEINGVNNAFVDITYTIYEDVNKNDIIDAGDTQLNTVTIDVGNPAEEIFTQEDQISPTDCTNYIASYTVTPIKKDKDGNIETTTGTAKFTIHVLQPDIAVNDLWVNYNTTGVNLREDCAGTVTWNQDSNHPKDVVVPEPNTATKPSVVFTFVDEDGQTYTSATFESVAITEEKTFKITKITTTSTDEGKTYNTDKVLTNDEQDNHTFHIYLNRFNLAITKNVNASDWEKYGQDLIVNVTQNGHITKVIFTKDDIVNGTATKTIEGLYAGMNFTVTEDTDWAWRWVTSYSSNDAISYVYDPNKTEDEPERHTETFIITNTIDNQNWISVSKFIKNIFGIEEVNP